MTKLEARGNAYRAVRLVYDSSPGRSWRRLNSALQDTLAAAITAHLSFLPHDFGAMCHDINGGYWMGTGEGITCGERYYSLMVKAVHTAACISFEEYAGRPAALWSESSKTPQRLCTGSQLTWEGLSLEVTSMQRDHLVACSYSRDQFHGGDKRCVANGDIVRLSDGEYRRVEAVDGDASGAVSVRLSAPVEDPYFRKIDRIVNIPYADLATVRKRFEKARKDALRDIEAAATAEDLKSVQERLAAMPRGTYRHFDIEGLREAVQDRGKTIIAAAERALVEADREAHRKSLEASYAADLEAWAAGQPARQWFRDVRLRVHGKVVETSTGQSASLESVKRVLPVVLRRRNAVGPVRNMMVDSYPVVEQSVDGVKVGCTWVPWVEVERLAQTIGVQR